jgi:nickel transport protein
MIYGSHRRNAVSAKWLTAAAAFFWLTFLALPAAAHKVSIFAWVDGETVYTQSRFSGGKRPRDAAVAIYDGHGNLLLEGKTDENGTFSFPVPPQRPIRVVLKASMGHLAEWTISEKDVAANPAESRGTGAEHAEAVKPAPRESDAPGFFLDPAEIEKAVDRALEKRLEPVMAILADLNDPEPGIREIVGGIGYIVGLAGVAFYVSARRKKITGN